MRSIETYRFPILVFLGMFLIVILTSSELSGHTEAQFDAVANNTTEDAYEILLPTLGGSTTRSNCRYGGGIATRFPPPNAWLHTIGMGHYINFNAEPIGPPVPESIEHFPVIRTRQDYKVNIVDGKTKWKFLDTYTINPPLDMTPSGLGPIVLANPGALWLAGNEPDVADPLQDHSEPEIYAEMYHEVYHFIKDLDPHAQVAIAGLSMMTPARLQYLDIVWDTYQDKYGEPMPVDVWNMHLYILAEINPWDGSSSDGKLAIGTDPALAKTSAWGVPAIECPKDEVYCRSEHDDMSIFMDQLIGMRTWMKDHGQQQKPLIISEYSQLYPFVDYDDPINPTECFLMDEFQQCFTRNRVTSFMENSIAYLEAAKDPNLGFGADDNRLAQSWTWFSLRTGEEESGGSSSLLEANYSAYDEGSLNALTQMGRAYRSLIRETELTQNLVAAQALDVTVGGGPTDVQLTVGFYNNGSGNISSPFKVTFYKDAALTKVIGSTEVQPGETGLINGCSWGRIADWASVEWKDAPVGARKYWVKVDSHNNIRVETDESDNVTSGTVTINS